MTIFNFNFSTICAPRIARFLSSSCIFNFKYRNPRLAVILLCLATIPVVTPNSIYAQASAPQVQAAPLSQTEFVKLINRLPSEPQLLASIIAEVRERGIGFEITSGLRSVIATRSRNDAELFRTLAEAARRRTNPDAFVLPPADESRILLERARADTLLAVGQMPDFVVKQQVARFYARGTSRNWLASDRLTVLVTYREGLGERYKLLRKNDVAVADDERERSSYAQPEGTSSTGEFGSRLAALFADESRAEFKAVDTDTLRGRRTIVYDYTVKLPYSKHTISAGESIGGFKSEQSTVVGMKGKVWIDRETNRVLRLESTATDIPTDFPVTAAISRIDYDWATIDEQKELRRYLMPVRAEIELTAARNGEVSQSRNVIRFGDYRKFGSKVELEDDDSDYEDLPPEEPAEKP